MQPYICEFLGTLMVVVFGNGVVCNCLLEKSGMKGGGSIQMTFGWGFGVMLPAFIFGRASCALFNPALALAFAIDGTIKWSVVPGYILSEMLGAMCGQIIVWNMFKDQFDATEDPAVKLSCFATTPSVKNIPRNIFSEVVCTFFMVFAIKGIAQVEGIAEGLGNVYVFGIICAIGMSLGGVTGYAMNPARDLGPRIMYELLPVKNRGKAHWDYAYVPVAGPIIGAILGVLVYKLIF